MEQARAAVAAQCRQMAAERLVVGTSGNISMRVGDLVAVSPAGLSYAELTPALVGVHTLDGTAVDAPSAPTSEMPMHLAIYRHTDAVAIVHTHSVAATAVSTLVDELPPLHYNVALFGGSVRVAPYATYGTQELADKVIGAMDGRTGCILANHGTVTTGQTMAAAYTRAQQLEWLCDVWLRARSVGEPRLLSASEIERVVAKLANY